MPLGIVLCSHVDLMICIVPLILMLQSEDCLPLLTWRFTVPLELFFVQLVSTAGLCTLSLLLAIEAEVFPFFFLK